MTKEPDIVVNGKTMTVFMNERVVNILGDEAMRIKNASELLMRAGAMGKDIVKILKSIVLINTINVDVYIDIDDEKYLYYIYIFAK